ncbi:hypothetical protein D3C80_1179840 [compost metagenome]
MQRLARAGAVGAPFGTGQHNLASGVDEIDAALVALLVLVDQLDHGIDGEPHASGTHEAVLVVEHLVVDEHCHFVLVGHVQVDVDFIRFGHVAHAEIPDVARLLLLDLFEHALGLIVGERGVGNEKGGVGAVVVHDFTQVAGHLVGVAFTGHHPVAHEGVARHHRGDQDRPHQVLLDFRVDRIRGQRQLGIDDVVADRVARGVVTEQGCRQETTAQQEQQRQDERALREQRETKRHGNSVGSDLMATILMAPWGNNCIFYKGFLGGRQGEQPH